MNILVVEDDLALANTLRDMFVGARHTVDTTEDGWAGRTLGAMDLYDVIILDRLLPSMDGLEVCRQLRAGGIITPILLCGVRADLDECVAALEAGADDYLAKPFALPEALARVNALGRWSRRREAMARRALTLVADGVAPATPTHAVGTRRGSGFTARLRHAWFSSRHWLGWGDTRAEAARGVAVVGMRCLSAHDAGRPRHRAGERPR